MRIRILFVSVLSALLCISCQKHSFDFTYSPASPKAGEKVVFGNTSDAGENWVWRFGDGATSTLKNPTHIFTSAGTYIVEMMADSSKQKISRHTVTVLDTVPTIYTASDTVGQYALVWLRADLYNPTGATVVYQWQIDEDRFVLSEGSFSSDSLCGYFVGMDQSVEVRLTVTMLEKTTEDVRQLWVSDNPSSAIVMAHSDGTIYRQRIYDAVFEEPRVYPEGIEVIAAANDSVAVFNGVKYDRKNMPVLQDLEVTALQVDPMNRKIYLVLDDGLYVANANGDYLTQCADGEVYTALVSQEENCLFWSADDGVWKMPLVSHPQNILSLQAQAAKTIINDLSPIVKMNRESVK